MLVFYRFVPGDDYGGLERRSNLPDVLVAPVMCGVFGVGFTFAGVAIRD